MIKWLSIDEATKRRAYSQIAENTGISAFAAEKDWWVVQTLAIVFEMDMGKHLVFKGGTSLSKAWRLIERFSEDIDLAIDKEFLGFNGDLGKNQRDKLRKVAGNYIDEVFFPALKAAFDAKGLTQVQLVLEEGKESDRDRKINLYYPNVIPSPGYLEPRVQIEISCRSLREPFTEKKFLSLLDETFNDQEFTQPAITIPSVNPERTFLEKIFLLHEEFQRPKDKMRVDRLSRHLYDVAKLFDTEFADKALGDPNLYETIVQHRYTYTRVSGVDYNLHRPQSINPLPIAAVDDAWRADYNTMVEQMIYEKDPPSYDELLATLSRLKTKINTLSWQLICQFPAPHS